MNQENPKATFKVFKTDQKKKNAIFVDSNPLAPLDLEKIAQEYDIDRTAQALGKQEIPNTDNSERIDLEKQIEQIYQDTVSRYHEYVVANIQNFDKGFEKTRISSESTLESLNMLVTEYDNKNFDIKSDYDKSLKKEKEDFKREETAYKNFVEENNLSSRPCRLTSFSKKVIHSLFLVASVIFEAIINASFFATNLDGGLLAGASYAAIASIFNVVGCFSIGYLGIVYILHRKFIKKLFGFFSCCLFLVYSLSVAFFVAHYRDALQSVEEGADHLALETLTTTPLELAGISSWLLLGITLLISLFSAAEGFNFKEPYPGYAKKEEAYRVAIKRWDDFRLAIKEHQEQTRDEALNSASGYIGKLDNDLVTLKDSLNNKSNLLIKYENSRKTAEKDVIALILRFRTKNLEARTTKAPAYFNEEITGLDISNIPAISTSSKEDSEAVIEMLESSLKEARSKKNQIQKDIYACYEKHVDILNKDLGEN